MTQRRKVLLLGSTGSIGTSALKVAQDIPDRMEIVGLAAQRSVEALVAQVRETGVKQVALTDEAAAAQARALLPADVTVHAGSSGLVDLVRASEADMVLVAIVGVAGLAPALAAIEEGRHLAVASKEILVMAGEAVMEAARRKGVDILPVDSEHNAIFQCLEGHRHSQVRRILLTASGGPFRQLPADQLPHVTVAQALKHPTWSMGRKITIDSATLMNKALEIIEAHWLFGATPEQIEVVIHPQSVIHSMVSYADGSVLAQLGNPDMRTPIAHALAYPDRIDSGVDSVDLAQIAQLNFRKPDYERFPCLRLAFDALHAGGSAAAVLNAANEIAVEAFLDRRLGFREIPGLIETVMRRIPVEPVTDLDSVLAQDRAARAMALEMIGA